MNRDKIQHKGGNTTMSLITTCCNGEGYLDDWSKSILLQKYRPLEVVFFDDKSRDNTRKLVNDIYFPKFRRAGIMTNMVPTHPKKTKYGGGLYQAAKGAKGSFFGILDVDDALVEGSIEYVMDLYKRYPDVAYIWTQFESYDCSMSEIIDHGFCRVPGKGETILSEGLKGDHVYSHFRTFSTRVPGHLQILPQNGKFAVDQHMGLRLEERAKGMFADRVCYKYRTGCPGTISHNYGARRRKFWRQMLVDTLEIRKQERIIAHPIIEGK